MEETSSLLMTFTYKDRKYRHSLFFSTDDRTEIKDADTGEIILTVTASSFFYSKGKRIGNAVFVSVKEVNPPSVHPRKPGKHAIAFTPENAKAFGGYFDAPISLEAPRPKDESLGIDVTPGSIILKEPDDVAILYYLEALVAQRLIDFYASEKPDSPAL